MVSEGYHEAVRELTGVIRGRHRAPAHPDNERRPVREGPRCDQPQATT